jgi:hypothetical protein
MSRFFVVIILFMSCWLSAGKLLAEPREVERARQHGAQGQVTLRVVDSTGKPVEQAEIRATFPHSDAYGDVEVSKGSTDTNGIFVAAGKSNDQMIYDVKKGGSYKTEGTYRFYSWGEDCVKGDRWQPWNPTNTVVLKEHRSPGPMCARRVDIAIPARDQAVGYDLEKSDWVAPHGQGSTADLIFKYTATYEGPQVFSKRMEITFDNPRDGVQSFALDRSSEFMSIYTAPEEGYTPEIVDEYARTRTKMLKSQEFGKGQYLVFRTRTVTNEAGRIVSANYGKIYGPNLQNPIEYGHMGDADRLMFTYYFNPTANDRNLEFDPGKNLLDVKRRVYQP